MVIGDAPMPGPAGQDVVRFSLRVPQQLDEALEKAINLGLIRARSKNDAINQLIANELAFLYMVWQLFEVAERKFPETNRTDDPMQRLIIANEVAGEVMKNPTVQKLFFGKMAEAVMTMIPHLDDEEFTTFIEKLKEVFEKEGEEE